MSGRPSLAGRAALAVGLMLGFYLLAVGIAVGLLSLPIVEWQAVGRVHIKLALGCLLGAGAILWAVMPRRDRFDAPGPLLQPQDHPRLFALIADVARQTGQAPPREVYLVPDVNAFVARRGGIMGFGSRPVMGLGLPLLAVLSEAQLRGVIAHEFGHFHGGDTRLGPWIYKTRAAIGRTLYQLKSNSVLQVPFKLYAAGFLRITLSISRAQELAADALAARIAGTRAMADGLCRVHAHAPFWSGYWSSLYVPALEAGLRVPLVEGFHDFLGVPGVRTGLQQVEAAGRADTTDSPYDSHPPLARRLAALEGLPPGPAASSDGSALALLQDPPALEERLIAYLVVDPARIKAGRWDDFAVAVILPRCRKLLTEHGASLAGFTPRRLPELMQDFAAWSARLPLPVAEDGQRPDAQEFGRYLLGGALLLAASRDGARLRQRPGARPVVAHDGHQFSPWDAIEQLSDGRLSPEAFRRQCDEAGVPECDLGPAAAPAAS